MGNSYKFKQAKYKYQWNMHNRMAWYIEQKGVGSQALYKVRPLVQSHNVYRQHGLRETVTSMGSALCRDKKDCHGRTQSTHTIT